MRKPRTLECASSDAMSALIDNSTGKSTLRSIKEFDRHFGSVIGPATDPSLYTDQNVGLFVTTIWNT